MTFHFSLPRFVVQRVHALRSQQRRHQQAAALGPAAVKSRQKRRARSLAIKAGRCMVQLVCAKPACSLAKRKHALVRFASSALLKPRQFAENPCAALTQSPANGDLGSCGGQTSAESTCSINCNQGYTVSGAARLCQAGLLTGQAQTCVGECVSLFRQYTLTCRESVRRADAAAWQWHAQRLRLADRCAALVLVCL